MDQLTDILIGFCGILAVLNQIFLPISEANRISSKPLDKMPANIGREEVVQTSEPPMKKVMIGKQNVARN